MSSRASLSFEVDEEFSSDDDEESDASVRGFNAAAQPKCDNICRMAISPSADFDIGLPAGAAAAAAEDGT